MSWFSLGSSQFWEHGISSLSFSLCQNHYLTYRFGIIDLIDRTFFTCVCRLVTNICVGACMCVWVWRLVNNIGYHSLSAVHHAFLKQGLSLIPGALVGQAPVGGQWAPGIRLSLSPSTGMTGIDHHAQLFMYVLGIELRSPCLQGKCFTNWAPTGQPLCIGPSFTHGWLR